MSEPRPSDLPQNEEDDLPAQVLIMSDNVADFNMRVNAVLRHDYTISEHGIFTQPNTAAGGSVVYGAILEKG